MIYDEIGFFGHPEAAEKWIEGKLNKTFLHFLPNFLMIFQRFIAAFCILHFEKSSTIAKIWQKMKKSPPSTFLQPISPWNANGTYPKPGFRVYPFLHH